MDPTDRGLLWPTILAVAVVVAMVPAQGLFDATPAAPGAVSDGTTAAEGAAPSGPGLTPPIRAPAGPAPAYAPEVFEGLDTLSPALDGLTPKHDLSLFPDGSYRRADGSVAVPMRADPPPWLTEEILEKTHEASSRGMAYDFVADEFVDLGSRAEQYALIRPGAWMVFPAWCTMNFVFGSPGDYHMGTAGHCVSTSGSVTLLAAPSLLFDAGVVVDKDSRGVGRDWAIVRIFNPWQDFVDPDTAVIRGPQCGAYTGGVNLFPPVPIKHFGHGLVVGTGGTPRTGVALESTSTTIYFDSVSAPGDSGSPVLVTAGPGVNCPLGQALAMLTHLVIFGPNLTTTAGTKVASVPTELDVADGNGLPV